MTDIIRTQDNGRMSKIVQYGGTIYLCGQTAKDSDAATGDIAAQTKAVLEKIDGLLAQAGSDRSRLLSVTIFLRDMKDFAGMNEVWEAWIAGAGSPARATVEANLATDTLLVELSVIAAAKAA